MLKPKLNPLISLSASLLLLGVVIASFPDWLKKSSKSLPEYNRPFSQHGILIRSGIACHERSFLDDKFKDEQLVSNYLGTLECDYINQLAEEFDEYTTKNKNVSDKNPELIIDENRIHGLNRTHPFTKALFQKPL